MKDKPEQSLQDKLLTEALNKFQKKYPNGTSADLQTFIKGWQAAVKNLKLKI